MAAPLSLIFQVYIHQKENKEQKVGLMGKDMKVGKVTEGGKYDQNKLYISLCFKSFF